MQGTQDTVTRQLTGQTAAVCQPRPSKLLIGALMVIHAACALAILSRMYAGPLVMMPSPPRAGPAQPRGEDERRSSRTSTGSAVSRTNERGDAILVVPRATSD